MIQKIVACAAIHHNFDGVQKLLLTRRSLNSDFLPGNYEIPGSHIEPGEDLVAGLKREIKEELGIEIEVQDPFAAFTYTHNDSHTVEVVYLATTTTPTNITIQQDEVDSFVWIAESEIDTVVVPNKSPNDQELPILRRAFTLLGLIPRTPY